MNRFSVNELKEYTAHKRLPFILHWNITEACNLRCTHCCVPKRPVYVSLESAYRTIEFLKEKGFFLITLSGGECLLHPHFKEIYLALKKAGMYVAIFTNGTVFTDEIKRLFAEFKPRKVEVSVYGHDAASFWETTGSKEGYDNFLDTLHFLKENGIKTIVKAPVTTKNNLFIEDYIKLAERFNAEYKFGTFVFPRLDGNLTPLNERLDYQKAVRLEFSDPVALSHFCERVNSKGIVAEPFGEKCSACNNSYTLNADDSFSFCGMMVEPKFYFDSAASIETAFDAVTQYRDTVIKQYIEGPCNRCKWANACPGCPAHLFLETGRKDRCNEYFRNITETKLKYASDEGLLSIPFESINNNNLMSN